MDALSVDGMVTRVWRGRIAVTLAVMSLVLVPVAVSMQAAAAPEARLRTRSPIWRARSPRSAPTSARLVPSRRFVQAKAAVEITSSRSCRKSPSSPNFQSFQN